MGMIGSFDVHNLRKLLKDFYTAIGIRISIFNDEFGMVTEYPEEAPEFCTLIRRTEEGRKGCKDCDRAACERAKLLRKPHIYTCHAGITEAITPIQLSGGVLGYAILAHMMPEENAEKSVREASILAERYGVERKESLAALKKIGTKTTEQINAAVKILDVLASYVYISNLVQWKNEDVSVNIEKYIRRHLSEPITNESVCKQFHCSRSYLYHVSKKTFGMGVMQYVTYCRIEKAKELLRSGKSIGETAELAGFSDYNYFCKAFRKHVGQSPAKFRSSKERES